VNSLKIAKEHEDLFIELLSDCGLLATELVEGCSRRRSLGQFSRAPKIANMHKAVAADLIIVSVTLTFTPLPTPGRISG
jgi:hypothetical protein